MAENKTVLAIGCHPDDVEFMMAGTLSLLAKRGWRVHILTVANGSCGTAQYDTETIVRMRREESERAAKVLGATYHPGLVPDLEVFYDAPTLRKVSAVVRDVKPAIVLTHPTTDYMEDHQNTGRLAVTACFSRGMKNWFTDPPLPTTSQDVMVYHANPHSNRDGMRRLVVPELYINITSEVEVKEDMLRCHESQKHWLDVSQGMDSYLHTMREICADIAKMSGRKGWKYAEGFRRHSHLGFSAAESDPLAEALKGCVKVNKKYRKALENDALL
ncbi:MAG TPA: PIG-L family deacetylase [Candidatus Brocadiia bacterium]|nr:PIG-L family deacetylase [Candidatus Brocadiia bacterium]